MPLRSLATPHAPTTRVGSSTSRIAGRPAPASATTRSTSRETVPPRSASPARRSARQVVSGGVRARDEVDSRVVTREAVTGERARRERADLVHVEDDGDSEAPGRAHVARRLHGVRVHDPGAQPEQRDERLGFFDAARERPRWETTLRTRPRARATVPDTRREDAAAMSSRNGRPNGGRGDPMTAPFGARASCTAIRGAPVRVASCETRSTVSDLRT